MALSELHAYQFQYCEVLKANNPDCYFKAVHVFKFKSDENRYLVTLEEYQHNLYVLHYCLEEHMDNTDKFNELTNTGPVRARKIIATCVQIGLSMYEKNPLASFAFIASLTTKELDKKNFTIPKRLSVNRYFALSFPESKNFTHSYSDAQNFYLMLNKRYEQQEPAAMSKIMDMLSAK